MENIPYHYPYVAGKEEARISEPTQVALMWDRQYWHYTTARWDPINSKRAFNNVLFCDGHVRPLVYRDLIRIAYGQ
jgi:prepilin-type processing-associated H-X9-DG protein